MQVSTLPRPELIQMADMLAREKGIEKEIGYESNWDKQ